MRQLQFADRARQDLAAIETYHQDRDDLVAALYVAAKDATDFLLSVPDAGSPVDGTRLRKWRIGRTPYLILYRATDSHLRIVRVLHERRNWRSWL